MCEAKILRAKSLNFVGIWSVLCVLSGKSHSVRGCQCCCKFCVCIIAFLNCFTDIFCCFYCKLFCLDQFFRFLFNVCTFPSKLSINRVGRVDKLHGAPEYRVPQVADTF